MAQRQADLEECKRLLTVESETRNAIHKENEHFAERTQTFARRSEAHAKLLADESAVLKAYGQKLQQAEQGTSSFSTLHPLLCHSLTLIWKLRV